MQEIQVQSLGWDDPLKEEMATHSSILAWIIPWTERSLVGYSPWGRKESDVTEHAHVWFVINLSDSPFEICNCSHVFMLQ